MSRKDNTLQERETLGIPINEVYQLFMKKLLASQEKGNLHSQRKHLPFVLLEKILE